MRRIPVLIAGLLVLPLLVGGARADAQVGYIGPTYFSDPGNARGGPSWAVRATGSQVPVDPLVYGADPDVTTGAFFTFSDANDAQGTVSPGISYWPRAYTPLPVS